MSENKNPKGNYNTKSSDKSQNTSGMVAVVGFGGLLFYSAVDAIFGKVGGLLAGKSCLGLFCNFF